MPDDFDNEVAEEEEVDYPEGTEDDTDDTAEENPDEHPEAYGFGTEEEDDANYEDE